jgi:uncharacterized protein
MPKGIFKNSRRGFAGMDKAKLSKIAQMGGIAAHKLGRAHEFSPEEAAAAGRKGGKNRWKNRRPLIH